MSIEDYFGGGRNRKRASAGDNAPELPPSVAGPSCSQPKKPKANQSFIESLDQGQPIAPILETYPSRKFGQETFDRHFKSEWYDGRPWKFMYSLLSFWFELFSIVI